tara:strand:- start:695 stop:922 length:228 start_codon:yes stop_codon:yes gene_type:complete
MKSSAQNPFAASGGVFGKKGSSSAWTPVTPLKTMRIEAASNAFPSKPKGACKKRKRKKGEIVTPALEDCYYEEEE